MSSAKPILIAQPLRGGRYEIDWDALEAAVTPRTKMLLYTSPSNPLGWVATEEDQDKLISTLETAVTSSGGQVKNVEKMGKRRLAYTVRKFHDGLYMLLTFEGSGGLVHELERRLRVNEPVIKFLSVRIDEEQKRLDKVKALRDARRKVSAAPPPPPAEPAGEAPAATA